MSRITLILAAALALAACGKESAPEQQSGVEQDINVVTAQGNDVTAIDAATSDDVNMAADVEFTLNEGEDNEGNAADGSASNAD